MRTLVLVMLLPAIAPAPVLRPVTVAPEGAATPATARRNGTPEPPRPFRPLVGTIDTVGGTTYDWWYGGPVWCQIANSPGQGLHVTWMHSQEMSVTTFADRQMRYSFCDYATNEWNWDSAAYIRSGVGVWSDRSGFGNLSDDPTTGCAVISRHSGHSGTMHVDLARDIAAGAGIFEYAEGSPLTNGYRLGPVAADGAGVIHQFATSDNYGLAYTRVAPFPQYESMYTQGWEPIGQYDDHHNIAASRVSSKVCATWTDHEHPVSTGYLRTSNDGGVSWEAAEALPPPDVYGGDTLSTWSISSLFPFYDRRDRLHIVGTVGPVVGGLTYIFPVHIAHYLDDRWSTIHIAGCDSANLRAAVGYNTLYAGRASIGEDASQALYVTWEQFDSVNVEPVTNLLRADIFCSTSADHGTTWSAPLKLTDAGTHSNRFPSISNWIDSDHQTVDVLYLCDQTAGFWVQNEHPGEVNPVIVQHIPIVPAVEEQATVPPTRVELAAPPTIVRSGASVSYALPQAGKVVLLLQDAAGRVVQTLAGGHREAGRYSERLSAAGLPAGVYLLTLRTGRTRLSRKVVLMAE
jgi:hypothetical protein